MLVGEGGRVAGLVGVGRGGRDVGGPAGEEVGGAGVAGVDHGRQLVAQAAPPLSLAQAQVSLETVPRRRRPGHRDRRVTEGRRTTTVRWWDRRVTEGGRTTTVRWWD